MKWRFLEEVLASQRGTLRLKMINFSVNPPLVIAQQCSSQWNALGNSLLSVCQNPMQVMKYRWWWWWWERAGEDLYSGTSAALHAAAVGQWTPTSEAHVTVLSPPRCLAALLCCSPTYNLQAGTRCSCKWPDTHCNSSSRCTVRKNLKGLHINLFISRAVLEDFFFFSTGVMTRANWSFSTNTSPAIGYFCFFHDCGTEKGNYCLIVKGGSEATWQGGKAKRRKHMTASI